MYEIEIANSQDFVEVDEPLLREVACQTLEAEQVASARISVVDDQGKVLARFDCRGPGHGSWIDAHGDIYLGLGEPEGVDKYIRQG